MNAGKTKLAIIINCYNYESYVQSAIESALAQDQNLCEIVVVDDGSTDKSWDIISLFPVKAYRKENGGQVSACLYGLSKVESPFVIFLDADDELMPNAVSRIIPFLDINVAKLQFPLKKINENGVVFDTHFPLISRFRDKKLVIDQICSAGSYLCPPTSGNVFRRDLCAMLADAHYDTAVDGIILLAAPFFGDIVSIDEPLGHYRVHGKNKSGIGGPARHGIMRLHQKRYLNRISHLNEFLSRNNHAFKIADPKKMYLYLRYENYCDILEHKPVRVNNIFLAIANFPKWYTVQRRLLICIFLLFSLVANKRLLAYLLELRLSGRWRIIKRKHFYK